MESVFEGMAIGQLAFLGPGLARQAGHAYFCTITKM